MRKSLDPSWAQAPSQSVEDFRVHHSMRQLITFEVFDEDYSWMGGARQSDLLGRLAVTAFKLCSHNEDGWWHLQPEGVDNGNDASLGRLRLRVEWRPFPVPSEVAPQLRQGWRLGGPDGGPPRESFLAVGVTSADALPYAPIEATYSVTVRCSGAKEISELSEVICQDPFRVDDTGEEIASDHLNDLKRRIDVLRSYRVAEPVISEVLGVSQKAVEQHAHQALRHSIQVLHEQGVPQAAIARSLCVSQEVVQDHVKQLAGKGTAKAWEDKRRAIWNEVTGFFFAEDGSSECSVTVRRKKTSSLGMSSHSDCLGVARYRIADLLQQPGCQDTVKLPLVPEGASASPAGSPRGGDPSGEWRQVGFHMRLQRLGAPSGLPTGQRAQALGTPGPHQVSD